MWGYTGRDLSLFNLYGLPQGPKPPPLSMLSPAASKVNRTTATVQPLTTDSPVSSSTAINAASRQSSFAAALRKLAKQATDLPEGSQSTKLGESSFDSSPGSSSSARTPTPKRAQPPGPQFTGHTSVQVHSPPVVTIAPTPSYSSIAASDGRKSVDRPGTASSASGSIIADPVSVKQERDRSMQPLALDRRDDDRPISKEAINMSSHGAPKVITPGVLPGSSSLVRDEGPGRGFQPYRHGEEVRPPYPSPYATMDPALYPYHAAAAAAYMTPHGFPHPAFRFDDPLVMERYRMMQGTSPFFAYSHPGMLPPAGLGLGYPTLPGYPPELLRQHHSMVSPSSKTQDLRSPAHTDRSEEERRERNREAEREKQREAERQREQDREKRRKEAEREHASKHSHNGPILPQAHKSTSSHHHQTHSNSQYSNSSVLDRHKWQNLEQHRDKDAHNSHSQHHSDTHNRDSPRRSSESHSHMGHPPPLVSHQSHTTTNHMKDPLKSFHRPFESSVVNGIDKKQWLGQQESQISKHMVRDLSVKKEVTAPVHDGKVSSERVESSQNDGMHSKLIESDKCFSSTSSTPKAPNQSCPVNRLPLFAGLINNHIPNMHRHKHPLNETRNDALKPPTPEGGQSCHSAVILNQPQLARSEPVVSKLDLEERNLHKARLGGHKDGDEKDKRHRMMMMTSKGMPHKLDKSPVKMGFLNSVGLTSQQDNSELNFMKQYKRLKLLNDVKQETEQASHNPVLEPKHIKSEELNREPDYKYKAQFLFFLGLHVVPPERRKEMLVIREACERDRLKRLNNYNAEQQEKNMAARAASKPHGELAEPTPLSLKRKLHERDQSDTPPLKRPSSSHMELKVPTPPHHTYLAAPHKHATHGTHSVPANEKKHGILQQSKEKSHEFAQEFHKSVLLSTRQQEMTSRIGPPRSTSSPQQQRPPSGGQRSLPERSAGGSSSTGRVDNSEVFKWPGIEVLLEAYQRHVEEQNVEKDVILDECKKLQKQNQELNQSAEALSRTMSEFLQNKQLLEQERLKSEGAIETLVKYVKGLR